jgi:hypothetical protein
MNLFRFRWENGAKKNHSFMDDIENCYLRNLNFFKPS